MVLFSLIIPLITYFGLIEIFSNSYFAPDVSFTAVVIKPFFILLIFIALIGVILYGAIKLGKSQANLLDVLARLGAFLVVPVALLLIALVISITGSYLFTMFLLLGMLSASFIIPLIVYSFKRNEPKGLDAFYCTFLTYIGIIILFKL